MTNQVKPIKNIQSKGETHVFCHLTAFMTDISCVNKNMQLNDFHVLNITYKQTGVTHRNIVYDDVQTFIDEIYTDNAEDYTFDEIPRENWTIDDCVNITSELLEDTNHHNITEEPRTIVNIMKQVNIPENLITAFVHEYMEHMFVKYGY